MTVLAKEEVDSFLEKYRKRGERTLSLLGKLKGFIDAKDTEFGREFLSDLIVEHERLLDKIAAFEATEEERMEYKVVRKLLLRYSEKINIYHEAIKEIKTNTKGDKV